MKLGDRVEVVNLPKKRSGGAFCPINIIREGAIGLVVHLRSSDVIGVQFNVDDILEVGETHSLAGRLNKLHGWYVSTNYLQMVHNVKVLL